MRGFSRHSPSQSVTVVGSILPDTRKVIGERFLKSASRLIAKLTSKHRVGWGKTSPRISNIIRAGCLSLVDECSAATWCLFCPNKFALTLFCMADVKKLYFHYFAKTHRCILTSCNLFYMHNKCTQFHLLLQNVGTN